MSKAAEPGKADAGEAPDVEQYLVKDPERFALNLARMIEQAGKAASAWAEPRERGEIRDSVSRADGRHGQDLLEGHRILAVRSVAGAGGADAALRRLSDRLGQRDQPRQDRRGAAGGGHARPRRQALPGPRMGQERLLRFPEAGLSRHLALGERPRREGRRAGRAHAPQGELLRQAGLQRDLALELHPDQPGTLPRNGRLQRREPRARHEDAGRGHRRRQGRPEAEAGRLFALRDRQEHRRQPRQDRRPQRRRRDHPVRPGDRRRC